MHRTIAWLAAGALLLTACQGGQAAPPTPPPTPPPAAIPSPAVPPLPLATPSPPPPPSPVASPSPQPVPAPQEPEPAPDTSIIEAAHGSAGPELQIPPNTDEGAGSGCTPGPGALPDGLWAGYVRSFGEGELSFDLACFLTVESAPPGAVLEDFDFRNDSPEERAVPVADGATWWLRPEAVRLVTEPDPGATPIPAADADALAAYLADTGNTQPFGWLLIEDGAAVEFYVPALASA